MSEEKYEWTTEYDEISVPSDPEEDAVSDVSEEEAQLAQEEAKAADELAARIALRKRLRNKQRVRRKRLTVLGIILVFVLLFTMCGREIFRLKAENYALRKQQEELKEERDRLAEELKKVGDKEYIKDQARKQLRLLDPGEIMFIFQDENAEGEETEAEDGAKTDDKGDNSN